MKSNKALIICGLVLTVSIIFSSLWISRSIETSTIRQTKQASDAIFPKGLITEPEAANYLSMSQEQFSALLVYDKNGLLGVQGTSFDTYRFIPFIEINKVRYFSKEQINKWIEYNTMNRTVRP
jgi:hypothetical protein